MVLLGEGLAVADGFGLVGSGLGSVIELLLLVVKHDVDTAVAFLRCHGKVMTEFFLLLRERVENIFPVNQIGTILLFEGLNC